MSFYWSYLNRYWFYCQAQHSPPFRFYWINFYLLDLLLLFIMLCKYLALCYFYMHCRPGCNCCVLKLSKFIVRRAVGLSRWHTGKKLEQYIAQVDSSDILRKFLRNKLAQVFGNCTQLAWPCSNYNRDDTWARNLRKFSWVDLPEISHNFWPVTCPLLVEKLAQVRFVQWPAEALFYAGNKTKMYYQMELFNV